MRALVLALLLAGCASPDPNLYTLTTVPGAAVPDAATPAGRPVVTVQMVSIPRYLQRLEIVRSVDGTRADVSQNDWWMEPMGAMVRRVFAADLAQRRPDALVLPSDALGSGQGGTVVELDVQEFDRSGDRIVLSGTVRATGGGGPPRLAPVQVVVPVQGRTTSDQVAAMSTALATAADVAARLSR